MTIYTIFGIFAGIALLLTLLRYIFRKPSNMLVAFAQNFVGSLFIFSGFIKANDPIGFGYKLEEYYTRFAEDLHGGFLEKFFLWFKGSADVQSIIVCVVEIALGFMLLIGAKRRFTLWTLLIMIVFFTFLTFYSAYYNKVTDCGCFGDFMHLTPWQSFGKDIALLIFIIVLVIGSRHVNPLLGSRAENAAIALFTAASTLFPIYTYTHLPVFDFRPYKPGTNITEAMKTPPGGEGKFETLLYYKNLKTGEVKEFTQQNYPWQDTLNWKYDTAITKTLVEPVLAPIHDFNITTPDGSDYTEDILNQPGPKFFLVCRDLSETKKSVFGQVNDFASLCKKDNVTFIGLTSSSEQEIEAFKKETGANFDFYVTDDTQLKTMIRSNPGLILLGGPVVEAMWPASALPSYNDVKEKYFKQGGAK